MNPEALIISDENFDGFIKHNPDNGFVVRATQPSGFTILNSNNSFNVYSDVDNSFTSYNTDNTYITL